MQDPEQTGSSLVFVDWRPSRAKLRAFGFIALAAFALLGWLTARGLLPWSALLGEARTDVGWILAAIGALSAGCSVIWPPANRPLFVGLTLLALPIGFVVSHALMAVLFYAVVLPIGLALRALGRDPLARNPDASVESYWARARPARPAQDYFRQY